MLIPFSKYHGTGNDFVMIDNRTLGLTLSQQQIAQLCHRRFGIGADGLILVEMQDVLPKMIYFNADGAPSSMCGNGGRCFVTFCQRLELLSAEGAFIAVDGMHPFRTNGNEVSLKMNDVHSIESIDGNLYLNTGSPHYVTMTSDLESIDLVANAHRIRYSTRFAAEGTNVNFVQMDKDSPHIRTYERGVENETLSCGTGATACAIAMHRLGHAKATSIPVKVMGGSLRVSFDPQPDGSYTNIWLTGPTAHVFDGTLELPA